MDILIRNVPDGIVGRIEKLAERHHRDRMHEIIAILENAVKEVGK